MQKKEKYERSAESQATLDAAMERLLEAFRTGQMAKPLAQVFLKGGRWASRWGTWNQILVAMAGAEDAATARQWQEMGRVVVNTGEEIWLMNPKYRFFKEKDEDGEETGDTRKYLAGFGRFTVHPVSCTIPIPGYQGESYEQMYALEDRTEFVRNLPLAEVAEAWGIRIGTYSGSEGGARGFMVPGKRIGLGVENLSTWTHELVHHAEHRLGWLTKAGQERQQEIVAEVGGAVLLTMLGMEAEADWGGAYEYVQSYAKSKTPEGLVTEVRALMQRIGAAVQLILDTAEEYSPEAVPVPA